MGMSQTTQKPYPTDRIIILWENKDGSQHYRDFAVSKEEMNAFWNAWKVIRPQKPST